MQSSNTFLRRTAYFLSSILFLTFLVLPTVDRFLPFAPETTIAESDTTKLPQLTVDPASWGKWFNAVRKGYLDRHYNLRNMLISWNSFMDTFVLATMTPASKVIGGKDNWLFLAQDRGVRSILEEARSPEPLPEGPVSVLANELERRRQWLADRGIRYIVVLTPNKNIVYPEKLPDALIPTRKESHLSQFVRYIREHTKVDVVDVTPALLEHKKDDQVFYAIDSHWNAHGGFVGYQEIIKPLKRYFPDIPVLSRDQFIVERYNGLVGDLAIMMGLYGKIKEDCVMYINKDWYKARGQSYDGPKDSHYFDYPQYSVTGNTKLPNAVVFHDSYWWELLPFLAEDFNKALYLWLNAGTETSFRFFDTAVIEREKPDVVIDEFAERYIVPPLHGHFNIKSETSTSKD